MKDISIFDFLKDLTEKKKDISQDERFNKSYSEFMVNRFLSCNPSTTFLALFMSRYPNIPKEMQYKFYLETIDKGREFFKYNKKSAPHEKQLVDKVKLVYKVGVEKAYEILDILNEEQKERINKSFGGKR